MKSIERHTDLSRIERLVQVLEPGVAEWLHGVPRRHDGVGLGINHVAELLHELQTMAL